MFLNILYFWWNLNFKLSVKKKYERMKKLTDRFQEIFATVNAYYKTGIMIYVMTNIILLFDIIF